MTKTQALLFILFKWNNQIDSTYELINNQFLAYYLFMNFCRNTEKLHQAVYGGWIWPCVSSKEKWEDVQLVAIVISRAVHIHAHASAVVFLIHVSHVTKQEQRPPQPIFIHTMSAFSPSKQVTSPAKPSKPLVSALTVTWWRHVVRHITSKSTFTHSTSSESTRCFPPPVPIVFRPVWGTPSVSHMAPLPVLTHSTALCKSEHQKKVFSRPLKPSEELHSSSQDIPVLSFLLMLVSPHIHSVNTKIFPRKDLLLNVVITWKDFIAVDQFHNPSK